MEGEGEQGVRPDSLVFWFKQLGGIETATAGRSRLREKGVRMAARAWVLELFFMGRCHVQLEVSVSA